MPCQKHVERGLLNLLQWSHLQYGLIPSKLLFLLFACLCTQFSQEHAYMQCDMFCSCLYDLTRFKSWKCFYCRGVHPVLPTILQCLLRKKTHYKTIRTLTVLLFALPRVSPSLTCDQSEQSSYLFLSCPKGNSLFILLLLVTVCYSLNEWIDLPHHIF